MFLCSDMVVNRILQYFYTSNDNYRFYVIADIINMYCMAKTKMSLTVNKIACFKSNKTVVLKPGNQVLLV